MLRPKSVVAIARTASALDMPVSMISNGTIEATSTLSELVRLPLASISFSIDGPELTHDSIRGAGAFARTKATIGRVLAARGGRPLPIVSLNFTITPWNHTMAPDMVAVAEELGVDRITLQHLWFTSPAQAAEEADLLHRRLGIDLRSISGHVISHDFPDIGRLVESVSRVRQVARASKVGVGFYPDLGPMEVKRYYSEPKYSPLRRCLSPWSSLVIKPNGDALFCPDLWITEYALGNVRESSIGEIWQSRRAREFRSLLWSERMFAACNRCCSLYGQ